MNHMLSMESQMTQPSAHDYRMPPSPEDVLGKDSNPEPRRQSTEDNLDSSSTPVRNNTVSSVLLGGIHIVSLVIDGHERLCLAQISNTLLKTFSYNEIHNRRVALGITCVQCTPVQLEILRRAGAMPISSRRCGMITRREAERLVRSFLEDTEPPKLPDNFAFSVKHACGWGCRGSFVPSRYNSSRAKCIKCTYCDVFFSPNKFIFHFHRVPEAKYHHPDAANFNSWRRHLFLDYEDANEEVSHLWEDVKAMFNGGSRKRLVNPGKPSRCSSESDYKRARAGDPTTNNNNIEKLSGISYPYPVLPMSTPTCPNVSGFVPRTPHPAFPFPNPEHNLVDNKVANSLADYWKNKNVPYCNPFGLLWAKNFGMYSDPAAAYRNAIDLSQSSQKLLSHDAHHKMIQNTSHCNNKGIMWKTDVTRPLTSPSHSMTSPPVSKSNADSYFSAFKPVAREGPFAFDHLPGTLQASPLAELDSEETTWSEHAHSVASDESPIQDNEDAFGGGDVDEVDINVTDIDHDVINDNSNKEVMNLSMAPHPVDSPSRHRDDVDISLDRAASEVSQGSSPQHPVSDARPVDEDRVKDESNELPNISEVENNSRRNIYSLSKEELQAELRQLMEERRKAEDAYEKLQDSLKKTASETSYRHEMEQQLHMVKEAHEALQQLSCKMMALKSCVDCN